MASNANTSAPSASDGTYRLLDSGHGRKLEQVGPYRIERQAANAFWAPRLPPTEWKRIDALHHRSQTGGGHWEILNKKMRPDWIIDFGGLRLKIKLTAFGHFGFFAEQLTQWQWFRDSFATIAQSEREKLKVLNLFGYTGSSSLALGQSGVQATHVDAAKGVVDWGRENQGLSSIADGRVRWIVDDCVDFLKREKRRGSLYNGIVLDPPSFGRGPNKQIFKIEENIEELLRACNEILVDDPHLVHFSCHSPGFTATVMQNLLGDYMSKSRGLTISHGELFIDESPDKGSGRLVPSGSFCRAFRKGTL